jgi:hypothetical protein
MEKNSPTFSHRTFWFLRGIEERVKWNVNTVSGEFNQMLLRHPLPRSNRSNPKDYLEPNSIVFIGT